MTDTEKSLDHAAAQKFKENSVSSEHFFVESADGVYLPIRISCLEVEDRLFQLALTGYKLVLALYGCTKLHWSVKPQFRILAENETRPIYPNIAMPVKIKNSKRAHISNAVHVYREFPEKINDSWSATR